MVLNHRWCWISIEKSSSDLNEARELLIKNFNPPSRFPRDNFSVWYILSSSTLPAIPFQYSFATFTTGQLKKEYSGWHVSRRLIPANISSRPCLFHYKPGYEVSQIFIELRTREQIFPDPTLKLLVARLIRYPGAITLRYRPVGRA